MISAVIVNFNDEGVILTNIRILNKIKVISEIIVIDNHSENNSLDLIKLEFDKEKKIKIIANSKNLGFAKACNIGAKAASKKNILFFNPDCISDEKSLTLLLKELNSDEKIGMVGGMLQNPDGSEQPGGRRKFPTPVSAFGHLVSMSFFKSF